MGWSKGKSRGSKCKVCKRYFKPHGMGPHMAVHNRIEVGPPLPSKKLRAAREKADAQDGLDAHLQRSMLKVTELRNEADRIEEAVTQVRGLMKLLS